MSHRPRPQPTSHNDLILLTELRAIKMALWVIALKMPSPTNVDAAVIARIDQATEKLTASTDFLADAVAAAEASIPGAT